MADLRALETPLPQSQPPPREEHRDRVPGWLARRMPSSDKLSPINQRRVANFKANRRGYWSLRIFLTLFVVTLFAEFLANDRPLLMSYKGEILSPVLTDYPELKFGGFLAVTDYKDPVILDEIKANGWAIWPLIRYSYDTINKDYPGRKGADKHLPRVSGTAAVGLERAAVRSAARSARPLQGVRQHQLARPRQSGARRRRPRHLRLPHLGAVRAAARHVLGGCRRHGRRRCRATSAAAPISSSSASSKCGPRYRRCSC